MSQPQSIGAPTGNTGQDRASIARAARATGADFNYLLAVWNERLPMLTLDATLEAMIVQGLHDPATGQPAIEPDLARTIGEPVPAQPALPSPSTTPAFESVAA